MRPIRPDREVREPWPSQRHATVAIPSGMRPVLAACRACVEACHAVTRADDEDEVADEQAAIVSDCALTCAAMIELIRTGARIALPPALAACGEDCRAAAGACREHSWEMGWKACEAACERCATLCEAYARS